MNIIVRVTDEAGVAAEKSFTLTVNNVNDPPALEEIPDASVNEEAAFYYQLTAADVDIGDALSFVGVNLPNWFVLVRDGALSQARRTIPMLASTCCDCSGSR